MAAVKASFGLTTKISIVSVVSALVIALLIAVISYLMIQQEMERQLKKNIEQSIQMTWDMLKQTGGSSAFYVSNGNLYVGQTLLNKNYKVVDAIKKNMGANATIFLGDMRISTNVRKDDGNRAIGTPLKKGPVYDLLFKEKKPYRGKAEILGTPYYTAYDPIMDQSGNMIGVLFTGIKESDFYGVLDEVKASLVKVIGLSLLVLGIISFLIIRTMMTLEARQLSKNLDKLMSGLTESSQATLGYAKTLRQNAETTSQSVLEGTSNCAGTLNQVHTVSVAMEEFSSSISEIERAVHFSEEMTEKGISAVKDLQEQVHTLTRVTEETDTDMQGASGIILQVSEAAGDMSSTVDSVAAAIEELSSSLREVAHNTSHAATVTVKAESTPNSAKQAMAELEEASKKINHIMDLISSIAGQTNLLALNATIEAASAGDAGKGFAVVANEVKELAKQSERATEEVHKQIQDIQVKTQESITAINAAVGIMSEITGLSQTMASAVEQQSATVVEISKNINNTASLTRNVSQGVLSASGLITKAADKFTVVKTNTVESVQAVDVVNSSLRKMTETSHKIASNVSEQTVATKELSQSANIADTSAQAVSHALEVISVNSNNVNAATDQMDKISKQLASNTETFCNQMSKFLAHLKS